MGGMTMTLPDRSLAVTLDGEPFPFSGRMRLRGKDELSLFPALFTLECWNLPEEYFLRLFRARRISVSHGNACLVSGRISDVFRHAEKDGTVTAAAVSLGLDLWESLVSLAVPAGASVSETVRRILASSGTGIPLLSFPEHDPVLPRAQSFFGRAAECVTEALSRCAVPSSPGHSERSEESFRAMLTPSGLMAVSAKGMPEAVQITGADLTDTVAFAGGTLRGSKPLAVLSAAVSGWRPGQTVEVRQGDVSFRGIVVSRGVDADTASGAWKCEMILEVI